MLVAIRLLVRSSKEPPWPAYIQSDSRGEQLRDKPDVTLWQLWLGGPSAHLPSSGNKTPPKPRPGPLSPFVWRMCASVPTAMEANGHEPAAQALACSGLDQTRCSFLQAPEGTVLVFLFAAGTRAGHIASASGQALFSPCFPTTPCHHESITHGRDCGLQQGLTASITFVRRVDSRDQSVALTGRRLQTFLLTRRHWVRRSS